MSIGFTVLLGLAQVAGALGPTFGVPHVVGRPGLILISRCHLFQSRKMEDRFLG